MEIARLHDPQEYTPAERDDDENGNEHVDDVESDEDSDEDGEQEQTVKAKFDDIIKRIDNGATISTLTATPDLYSCFGQKTNDHLKTLLHIVAEGDYNSKSKRRPLVKYLMENHGSLIHEEDISGMTPLRRAIRARLYSLVSDMCNYAGSEALNKALKQQDHSKNNCLHEAMLMKGRNDTKIAAKLISCVSEPETLLAQNRADNTPLHIAVEWERCTELQLDIVRGLIKACDSALDVNVCSKGKDKLSVYRYHEKTRREAKTRSGNSESNSSHKPGVETANSSHSARSGLRDTPEIHQISKKLHQSELTPKSLPSRSDEQPKTRSKESSSKGLELPTGGVQRQPTRQNMGVPMIIQPDESKSAKKSTKSSTEKRQVSIITANEIRDLLKLHYMETRDDHEKLVSYLYGPVQGERRPSRITR